MASEAVITQATTITPDTALAELGENDNLSVECPCGRLVEITHRRRQYIGWDKDNRKIGSLKFKCRACGATAGFGIAVSDERGRGNPRARNSTVIIPMSTTKDHQCAS